MSKDNAVYDNDSSDYILFFFYTQATIWIPR